MNRPLVSILIPAYNAERWLAETIRSVQAQTWRHWEAIIVDDQSTDNTLAVARSFESAQIKVVPQENAGASVARNIAFSHSQGEMIQYLDADDLLLSDKIDQQLKALAARKPDRIASGAWARFTDSPAEAKFRPEATWKTMSPVEWLVCSWSGGGMMHTAGWLTPRAICERAGPWNPRRCSNDDGEYFCRALLASDEVVFVSEAKSLYRSGRAGSLSGYRSLAGLENLYESLDLCRAHLLKVEDSSRTRRAAADMIQRFIYSAYPEAPSVVRKAETSVQQLGGSSLPLQTGPLLKTMQWLLGWKAARRVQRLVS